MNRSDVEISVIVPVYNVDKFLSKCIDSILSQTFSNFELILIDDGSSDNSSLICDEYAQKDKRIKVFHNQNSGVSKARNFGIEKSNGFYITFIDSDDIILPDYIEKMYAASKISDDEYADIVTSGFTIVNLYTGKKEYNMALSCQIRNKKGFRKYIIELEKCKIFNGPCNKIFRKDIIIMHNIKYPETLSFGEDLIFCYDYLSHCNSLVNLNYSGYIYLQRGQGLSCKFYLFEIYDKMIEKQYNVKCKFIENNIEYETSWSYIDNTIIYKYISFWQSLMPSIVAGESLKNLRTYLDKYMNEQNYFTYKLHIKQNIESSIISNIISLNNKRIILYLFYGYSKMYLIHKKLNLFLHGDRISKA